MSAPARLLGLRIQGFKSFAERTLVEFGPGVSAVVGPNGSGKSNLADALRWALGEQGRSLRIRKSEDVIWAGSERRPAQGMADVTLVLDNSDALLPVDFSVIELGRRLYRSGENDYLLNRQRVRLRDLQELLDGANLAENAFLFIGQGMVDQALALRPEERRPLFEEVAGVRRHERRRRRAEQQLAEAEANLARVEDILAELRPQARRLGQLAEQQATRRTAGEELAAALIAAAHARWHEAAARVVGALARQEALRAETDGALAALEAAESAVGAIASGMAARAETEGERRAAHDAARASLGELALRSARAEGELAAADRDRTRIAGEIAAAEAEIAAGRRALAEAVPEPDLELEAALREADRDLGEAISELAALRAASREQGDRLAALRRAEAARAAEAETARRRSADAERRAADERARAVGAAARQSDLEEGLGRAREALAAAVAAEAAATADRERARALGDAAEGTRREAAERAAGAGSVLAAARGRHEGLARRLAEDEQRGIARAARRLGGRRVDEDLVVDPPLRAAVEAALDELARAYVVGRADAASLAAERGRLVVRERLEAGPEAGATAGAAAGAPPPALVEALAAVGGGPLADAVRRDPGGVARPLLARAVWARDLESVLALQGALPAGWIAVARDGSAVADALSVRLGRGDSPLERRAELERLERDLVALAAGAAAADAEAAAADAGVAQARAALDRARGAESAATSARRRAEEVERTAGRAAEAAAREAAWHAAQAERMASEATRAAAALAASEPLQGERSSVAPDGDAPAAAAWEDRVAALRARRDRLAGDAAGLDQQRRAAETRRARAEAAAAIAEARVADGGRELAALAERERAAREEHEALAGEAAEARAREARARAELESLLADDRAARLELSERERAATAARERLRTADERARAADVAVLEARLGLEALREQLLVELAGLGELAVRHLARVAGADDGTAEPVGGEDDSAALGSLLDAAARHWSGAVPEAEPPSAGRLASLRRRFHELGAANPFAVDEYRTVRSRLEALDAQDRDLRDAIARTRALVGELDTLIATQFRATFARLEVAFDRRFVQLFGGGFARLALTDPDDLGSTGIEITARPPGKKPQALAMLSGGERALTAVALLFAMLEVRPAPFCVLDEVDAALDEANVGRFTEALVDLSEQTQFVVITHNRGTIESADALYGVTVGDDSVSRVISLRLDEAQAIAERHGPQRSATAVGGAAG